MNNNHWTALDIPDITGKTAVITGANSGIGYEIALELYKSGAHVILACRDRNKAQQAVVQILSSSEKGTVRAAHLDLADLDSVKSFSEWLSDQYNSLDILINNAGVMYPPAATTVTGYELQFATNFLGHFALTARLFGLLLRAPQSRVVTMSSGAYKRVKGIDFDNLRLEKEYDPTTAYGVSKLAVLMFALEFDKRCRTIGYHISSSAAHPGVTRTPLQRHINPEELEKRMSIFGKTMSPAQAALPALFAATSSEATGGSYYGPNGGNEYSGYPGPALITETPRDEKSVKRLWDLAEDATGITLL